MLTALVTLLYASGTRAETFTVTNTNNSGAGSLRAAIKGANYSPGADEIVFADGVSGTITLGSHLSKVTDEAGLIIDRMQGHLQYPLDAGASLLVVGAVVSS